MAQLAREVMARCQLIPACRQPELEQAIFYLQNRRPPQQAAKQGGYLLLVGHMFADVS